MSVPSITNDLNHLRGFLRKFEKSKVRDVLINILFEVYDRVTNNVIEAGREVCLSLLELEDKSSISDSTLHHRVSRLYRQRAEEISKSNNDMILAVILSRVSIEDIKNRVKEEAK